MKKLTDTMKISTIISLCISLLFCCLSSCGNMNRNDKDQQLSSDIIKNPASAAKNSISGQLPVMTFIDKEHDFGKLIQGETVSFGFKFTNTGGSDLIIASVSSSCGCTITDYPKDPVPPGKEGVVTVTFKTEGKRGFQHKTVTVMANSQPNTVILKVNAEIRLPEEDNND